MLKTKNGSKYFRAVFIKMSISKSTISRLLVKVDQIYYFEVLFPFKKTDSYRTASSGTIQL